MVEYLLRDLGHQKVYVIMCGRGSGWGMMGMAYVTDAVRTYSDLTMCRTKYYLNEIILNSVIFSNYELERWKNLPGTLELIRPSRTI